MGSSLDSLAEPLRSSVKGLVAESGGTVTWTSTRRTRAEQAALRIKNGCPDVYDAPATACRITTARPGESQHEKGLAIDFTNTPAVLDVVARLAPKYGIHRTVPGEAWHYEHVSTSQAAADAPTSSTAATSTGGGKSGIVGALHVLTDGRTWVRVLQVIGGLVLAALGLALLGVDLNGGMTKTAGEVGNVAKLAAL